MIKLLNVKSIYSSLNAVVEMCRNKEEDIEIIVPDKLSLFMEKFLFEKLNIESSFNLRVSTLNRFAKRNITISKDKQITTNGSILLIYKILNENSDLFNSLKSKKYSFSYAENIYATISQLKASRIQPEEMLNFESKDVRLTGKIKDLALIYKKYEELKAGLLDVSDVFLMSVFSVAEGKENTKLIFVGFDDFTAIQYAIIEQLAIKGDVNIFNYYSNKSNARIYNREVYEQLKNIAYINKLGFEVEDVNVKISNTKSFLEDNIFGFLEDVFELTDEAIKVYEANNYDSELEFVARDIKNKIIEGDKFSNFGVAVFGLENRISKIKEIFEKYEINYYIDDNLTLNNSIFYKFLISVFKFNENLYDQIYLIDIINTPYFKCDTELKRKFIDKILLFKANGLNLNKLDFGEDLNIVKVELLKFLELFKIEPESTVEQIYSKIKEADQILDFNNIASEIIDDGLDLQNRILLEKSTEMVYGVFEDVLMFYKDADFETFVDIFSRIANVVKVNNLPLSLDSVKIVDASNNLEIFKHLYLVNCTSDSAPKVKSDCGIILDKEIEQLNFSFKLSPTIAHINKLERLRLFNSSLLFDASLTVTYTKQPSELIKELLKRIKVKTSQGSLDLSPIYDVGFGKYVALSEWDYIEYLCKNDYKNKKIFEKLIKNKEINNISYENLNIYKNLNKISATQIENYFKCPFYYFLTNILKINSRLKNDILSFDIVNILHEILKEYYTKNKQVEDVRSFVEKQIFKMVSKDERLKINQDSPILQNLIEEAIRVIEGMNYIDSNTQFETNKSLLEVEFSNKNALKLKNIDIVGKIDRIDIFGNMARIIDYKSGKADASLKELYYGNKVQLFLYSCACENWLKKNVVGGFYLPLHNNYEKEQGNSYALKGFFLNEESVVSALDKRLLPGDKSDIVNIRMNKENKAVRTIGYKELTVDEMRALKEYSKTLAEQAVEEIKSGYIKPSPCEISKPCEFCDYSHICLRKSSGIEYRQTEKIVPESFKRGEYESI